MKTTFASVVVLAALCGIAPLHAAPLSAGHMLSVGNQPMNSCFDAAARDNAGTLEQFARRAAIADCDTALSTDKLRPEDRTATLTNRGILKAKAGNIDAAMEDYSAALARDPNSASIYIARGSAELHAQRYDDARADFEHALSLNPNNVVAVFDRGVANEASGNVVAAYHDYKKAQSLDPSFQPASVELARFKVTESHVATR